MRYLTSLVDPMAGNNDGWNSLHIACLLTLDCAAKVMVVVCVCLSVCPRAISLHE